MVYLALYNTLTSSTSLLDLCCYLQVFFAKLSTSAFLDFRISFVILFRTCL